MNFFYFKNFSEIDEDKNTSNIEIAKEESENFMKLNLKEVIEFDFKNKFENLDEESNCKIKEIYDEVKSKRLSAAFGNRLFGKTYNDFFEDLNKILDK